jgi:DNA replication and repair protein RecF
MKILSVRMNGFRNLADLDLEFTPGVNIFIGHNAQGKTNLLEALDFPSLGRSHRGARNEELIRHNATHLHVSIMTEADDGRRHAFEFGLDRQGDRRMKVNGQEIRRRADLVGRLATVFFWPQSNELVRGGPEHRRRFADHGICAHDSDYMTALSSYQRSLRQKTRLLRDLGRNSKKRDTDREIAVWNEELARHTARIGTGRMEWSRCLQPLAEAVHRDLAATEEPFSVIYRPRLKALAPSRARRTPETEIHGEILAEFDYIGPEEKRRGRPLTGIQFDDFEVRSGDVDLRTFGSRGETRTAALSLIFAQSELVFQKRRVRPVLFLDDIFSELDRGRSRSLQERCARDHQVFIATARAEDVEGWNPAHMSRWLVEGGRVSQLP